MLPCIFWEMFKNTFFYRTPLVSASKLSINIRDAIYKDLIYIKYKASAGLRLVKKSPLHWFFRKSSGHLQIFFSKRLCKVPRQLFVVAALKFHINGVTTAFIFVFDQENLSIWSLLLKFAIGQSCRVKKYISFKKRKKVRMEHLSDRNL